MHVSRCVWCTPRAPVYLARDPRLTARPPKESRLDCSEVACVPSPPLAKLEKKRPLFKKTRIDAHTHRVLYIFPSAYITDAPTAGAPAWPTREGGAGPGGRRDAGASLRKWHAARTAGSAVSRNHVPIVMFFLTLSPEHTACVSPPASWLSLAFYFFLGSAPSLCYVASSGRTLRDMCVCNRSPRLFPSCTRSHRPARTPFGPSSTSVQPFQTHTLRSPCHVAFLYSPYSA